MNMKKLSAAILAALISTAASANIIYSVNHTIGAGSIAGTIETDGALGVISAANIVNWTLTVNSASFSYGTPATLTNANGGSIVDYSAGALSATATDLIFDYAASGTRFLLFWQDNSQHYYCLQTSGCYDYAGGGEAMGYGPNGPYGNYAESQRYSAAQAFTNHAVPEPSLPALVALGLVGVALSRRKQG